jgi:hypothetical protein
MRVSSERQLGGRVSNFELSLLKSRNPQVGLSPQEGRREHSTAGQAVCEVEIPQPRKQRRRPGQRRPTRDVIARPELSYATAAPV